MLHFHSTRLSKGRVHVCVFNVLKSLWDIKYRCHLSTGGWPFLKIQTSLSSTFLFPVFFINPSFTVPQSCPLSVKTTSLSCQNHLQDRVLCGWKHSTTLSLCWDFQICCSSGLKDLISLQRDIPIKAEKLLPAGQWYGLTLCFLTIQQKYVAKCKTDLRPLHQREAVWFRVAETCLQLLIIGQR